MYFRKILTVGAILLIFCMYSGSAMSWKEEYRDQTGTFRVELIHQRSDWYFIYVSRNDSLFKIVSKAPQESLEFPKIEFHKSYYFELKSHNFRLLSSPLFEDIELAQFPGEFGVMLDEKNNVSVRYEPQNNIYDWYSTPNLIGLYYFVNPTQADSILSKLED